MASAQQLKALLKSYIDGDASHFYAVAMQVAAHEAKLGHGNLARELRTLIDEAKKSTRPIPAPNQLSFLNLGGNSIPFLLLLIRRIAYLI